MSQAQNKISIQSVYKQFRKKKKKGTNAPYKDFTKLNSERAANQILNYLLKERRKI